MKRKLQILMALAGLPIAGAVLARTMPVNRYLDPQLKVGESYTDVFSIMHSAEAEGYDEYVRRNGGSADYQVSAVGSDDWSFKGTYRYDGQPAGTIDALRDGGRTVCLDGKCDSSTDGTGLIYNPALWGAPPNPLTTGMTWKVSIGSAWELGGADSTQTVTVLHMDPATDTVTLMREGSSEGFFDGQPSELKLTRQGQAAPVTVVPGKSHWRGYATFRKGIVISDELVATRQDIFRDQDGHETKSTERWIMLLEAAPSPADPD